jgi:hypothetical protein
MEKINRKHDIDKTKKYVFSIFLSYIKGFLCFAEILY